MNCPKDVTGHSFKTLLDEVPRGFVLTKTLRIGDTRYFRFDRLARRDGQLMHDSLEVPIYCKGTTLH